MQLSETTLVIRPRNPWEAIDLGVRLAARHWRVLTSSWALATLPLFAVLTLLLWQHPSVVLLLMWWLKPAFERLPLYVLSQALFAPAPSTRQALREWLRLLPRQLLASLTWRRLSLSRSFTLPVLQLEGLDGQPRVQRLAVLRRDNRGAARWLTLVGMHLEAVLGLGAVALVYMLTPHALSSFSEQPLLDVSYVEAPWLIHLRNGFYLLILLIWEPIYVACGFTLYLNRRTVLEAWDIELQFRRLRQRLAAGGVKAATLLMLLAVLGTLAPSHTAWAEPASAPLMLAPATGVPPSLAPPTGVAGPQSPRLLHQPLSSEAAQRAVQAIVLAPPFKNPQSVERWRWKASGTSDASAPATLTLPAAPAWPQTLARIVEVLLWGLLLALLIVLVWHRREWLATLVERWRPDTRQRPAEPRLMPPTSIASALPDDIAGSAERLWPSQPREALSLLYRGLLSRLRSDYRLPLRQADTEGQVLAQVARLQHPALEDFSRRLMAHWQALAYGHQPVATEQQQRLLADWRALFDASSTHQQVRP